MSTLDTQKEALLVQVKNYLIAAGMDAKNVDNEVQRVVGLLDEIVAPPQPFSSWV